MLLTALYSPKAQRAEGGDLASTPAPTEAQPGGATCAPLKTSQWELCLSGRI